MDNVPVFRVTIIAAYDARDAEREARTLGLRRTEWVYAGNGEQVRGHSPECPLVVTRSFPQRRNAMAIAEELRHWKGPTETTATVDAPTQSG